MMTEMSTSHFLAKWVSGSKILVTSRSRFDERSSGMLLLFDADVFRNILRALDVGEVDCDDGDNGDISNEGGDKAIVGAGAIGEGFMKMSTELESGFTNVISADLAGSGCRQPSVAKISFFRTSAGLKTGLGGGGTIGSVMVGIPAILGDKFSEMMSLVSSSIVEAFGTGAIGVNEVCKRDDCC